MAKFTVRTYDAISPVGLHRFSPDYIVAADADEPDAIMLRSHVLASDSVPASVLAVGRAGAGVNNIAVPELSARGVVVFNAPGANANSVKELVLAGMLLAARNLPAALAYTKELSASLSSQDMKVPTSLSPQDLKVLPTSLSQQDLKVLPASLSQQDFKKAIERGKKQFAGHELASGTLGVIGLGAIGYRVANTGVGLGMRVLGYDPHIAPENEAELSPQVHRVAALDRLIAESDFVTLHVPLLSDTENLIDAHRIALMRPGAVLLNFAREEVVDEDALVAALDAGQLRGYVTDFPGPATCQHDKVIALPHLGASTSSAEDNCAVMIADELQDFLENGNIRFSVNFPAVSLPRRGYLRLTLAHRNTSGVIAEFSQVISGTGINIVELSNDSRGEFAYSIMELEADELPEDVVARLERMPQLLRLRLLPAS